MGSRTPMLYQLYRLGFIVNSRGKMQYQNKVEMSVVLSAWRKTKQNIESHILNLQSFLLPIFGIKYINSATPVKRIVRNRLPFGQSNKRPHIGFYCSRV